MGYTVLYIAFGLVALWLLGEVALQQKARLRWRLLTFVGFLGVAGGVVMAQVLVIVAGALAFGAGQTLVTLSHRRGFTTGWVLGGSGGSSRRRGQGAKTAPVEAPAPGITEEFAVPDTPEGIEPSDTADTPLDAPGPPPAFDPGPSEYAERTEYPEYPEYAEYPGYAEQPADTGHDAPAPVYSPTPLPDESGEYGIYSDRTAYVSDPYTSGGFEGYGAPGYGTEWQEEPQPATAAFGQESYAAAPPAGQEPYGQQSYDQQSYPQQPYQQPYDPYGTPDAYGQQQYPQQPEQQYEQQPYGQEQTYAQQGWTGYEQPTADGWPAADPYGAPQPHIPQQQTPPAHDPTLAEQPYDPYQGQESYQGHGY